MYRRRTPNASQEKPEMIYRRLPSSLVASAAILALIGCSHEAAFQRKRAECQKSSIEAERTRCLQKVDAQETEYRRQQNETRIEQSYKRKLEDMRPR
jgi:hypothetical protein